MPGILFSKKDLTEGAALLKAGKVGQALFSEGTYQVEVSELKKRGLYWPFLQLDDEGHILDCFCSCQKAEKERSCAASTLEATSQFEITLSRARPATRKPLWVLSGRPESHRDFSSGVTGLVHAYVGREEVR